jgi:hypothetical protein
MRRTIIWRFWQACQLTPRRIHDRSRVPRSGAGRLTTKVRMNMDAQALMDLCRINEESRARFNLGTWRTICGTACCLVGNFCVARPGDSLRLINESGRYMPFMDGVRRTGDLQVQTAARFGITVPEACFLFGPHDKVRTVWGRSAGMKSRDAYDMHAAVRRVRKYLYYKLRKREFCYDEKGCVRESARRMEGDHNFARQALACC